MSSCLVEPIHTSSALVAQYIPRAAPDLHFLDLRNHSTRSASVSSGMADGNGEDSRHCEICAKTFDRPSNYLVHMRTHTGEQPFACPHEGCESRFSIRSNLNRHLKTKHQDSGGAGSEDMSGPEEAARELEEVL